jgi:ABC-type phosphate transport system substrate-binding protein
MVAPTPANGSGSHVLIQGTGSTWAANAVNQWDADVTSQGLQVVFTGSGSAQGRKDFANDLTDFGVTDIGFQGIDPGSNDPDSNCVNNKCRPYAYEPVVAGGTSFPYQIKVAGQLVRNLRLSGLTLAKIFTYKITNWDDPEITADNNGRKLPSLPIIVVSHSEGSGSTAQFTTYLWKQFPTIWNPFNGGNNFTEYFPSPKNGQHGIQQNGSDGVMNFITSAAADGAIGYDEYSYALAKNYPVAKVLNKDGYYTLPSEYAVAVALTHAIINMNTRSPNYLLQDLHVVYVAPEPQVYPLSSYSYILVPTGTNAQDSRMTTAKRQTLADYLNYAVCAGQEEMGKVGYSPLPLNLVQASFNQTAKLKAADAGVDLTNHDPRNCKNPTFDPKNPNLNSLAENAPVPPICDKQGQGPMNNDGSCPGGGGGAGGGSGSGSSGSSGGGSGGTAGASKSGANSATGGSNASNPFGDTGSTSGVDLNAQPQPADLASYHSSGLSLPLGVLAVGLLIALLVLPPVLIIVNSRRRRKSP